MYTCRLKLKRLTPKVRRHSHIPKLVVRENTNHTDKKSMIPMLDNQETKAYSQKT